MNDLQEFGIDGISCTIFTNAPVQAIDCTLKNEYGIVYGSLKNIGENIKLRANIPMMIRCNNFKPYGANDLPMLLHIKARLEQDIRSALGGKEFRIYPNAVEVNVTKHCASDVSDIIKLFELSYMDPKRQLLVWINKDAHELKIRATGLLVETKVNEYKLKVYDKSRQLQAEKGAKVKANIIRVEMIFQGRRLRMLYGDSCTLDDILGAPQKLVKVFKRKYNVDVKHKAATFLSASVARLFEELTLNNRPKDAILKCHDIIVDTMQIERALTKYFEFTNAKQNQSKSISIGLSRLMCLKGSVVYEFMHLADETTSL